MGSDNKKDYNILGSIFRGELQSALPKGLMDMSSFLRNILIKRGAPMSTRLGLLVRLILSVADMV